MKFKGIVSSFLVAALALSVTTAMAADKESKYAVKEPITIEWWHALEAQYDDLVQDVVKQFNDSSENVTLEAVYQGSYSQLNEKVIAAHAAGNMPAISAANTPYVAQYGSSGVCEILDPYIEADDYDIEDFGEGLIISTSYDGKQVSFPFLISTQCIFYNKTLAEELCITPPETWEELGEFLKAGSLKDGDEILRYGSGIPGWDQWYFETYWLNSGVEIVTEDNTTDLNGEKALEISKQFQEWYNEGYINWCYGTDASTNMRNGFFEEKYFSVMHTTSLYNLYVDSCDFEVGMLYYPGADTRISEVGGSIIFIPAKNTQEVKNAAWEALKFLVGKDVSMQWAEGSGYFPVRKSVIETEAGQAFLELKPEFNNIFDHLDSINPRIQHPAYSTLARTWMDTLAKVIIEGNDDMEKSLNDAAKIINEALEDF